MRKKIEYNSNNSGGDWWLTDENWLALEKAGWTIEWYKNGTGITSRHLEDGERWLGALASRASKVFEGCDPIEMARDEFEELTGQNPWASGCYCCGAPHYFKEEDV